MDDNNIEVSGKELRIMLIKLRTAKSIIEVFNDYRDDSFYFYFLDHLTDFIHREYVYTKFIVDKNKGTVVYDIREYKKYSNGLRYALNNLKVRSDYVLFFTLLYALFNDIISFLRGILFGYILDEFNELFGGDKYD